MSSNIVNRQYTGRKKKFQGLWAGWPDERKGPPHDQDLPGSATFVSDLNLASEQQKCLDSKILPVQSSTKRHNLNMTEAIEELLVKGEHPAGDGVRTTEPYFDSATVECAIQLCPEQLKNGEMLLAMMCWF
ncbi:hypothetical protein fugu_000836 [Takifugu bimaculatus]|uniref:Uncharacterized protein n=1 Tax=Takifugu bimaculatus TaxID=433685 RepID=A0A4Z2CHU5_9TELE|nr:hypothetical protein fugu_000836 [Takifugu bimaculatus]